MKQVTINLYSFSELSKEAKKTAIQEHWTFLNSVPVEQETETGEMKEIYEDYKEKDVIENILINEYIYFANGELANCTTYTGKHPKTGTTEFKFHGIVYDITK